MFYPLKFKPIYKDYIWGGRNLEKMGMHLPQGKIAEAWEISCHPDGMSIIANGLFEGLSLSEFLKIEGKEAIGSDIFDSEKNYFPLLLKLIDASDKLSVQVHPGNKYANDNENGELGKREAWYIISSKPESRIIYNVISGTDKNSFEKAINENEIDSCLNYVNVFPGDVIDIYPGIIHSIGAGIVLAEIQQNSNITYRLYDYDRMDEKGNKRLLNIKKALDVMDFTPTKRSVKSSGLDYQINSGSSKSFKLANKYFSLEIYTVHGEIEENTDGSKFYIYLFIEGEACISFNNGTILVKAGESIFIPASMGKLVLKGSFKALKMYVPDFQLDIISPLMRAGHSLREIDQNVFN